MRVASSRRLVRASSSVRYRNSEKPPISGNERPTLRRFARIDRVDSSPIPPPAISSATSSDNSGRFDSTVPPAAHHSLTRVEMSVRRSVTDATTKTSSVPSAISRLLVVAGYHCSRICPNARRPSVTPPTPSRTA